jgi:F420-non-reducing hydrogenase iron-sulfur subunit
LGADLAGTSKLNYPTNVRSIRVMCTAMLNPSLVFEAFFNGADGVIIAGCHPQDCHYDTGFIKATNRYESIREILREAGLNENRVRIESISAGEGEKFARVVSSFKTELDKLGPLKPEEYQKQNVSVNKKEKKKAKLNEL